MGIENIIAALICLVAAVVYTVLAIRAEKARFYHWTNVKYLDTK
ncbi:hypothetical protein [Lactococcus petauri]